jgi:hypothetical protein
MSISLFSIKRTAQVAVFLCLNYSYFFGWGFNIKDKKMANKRSAIDAKKDKDGNIIAVLLEGNKNFTSAEKALEMTKSGIVDLVVVNRNGKEHIRTRPDNKKGNNLDEMADD